jgi:hypothetical protein
MFDLAVIAIGISTVTLLWTIAWSIYTYRAVRRPNVRVTANWSLPMYGPHVGEAAIGITAANVGLAPVLLDSAQLRIRGRSETLAPMDWVYQEPSSLPIRLEAGDRWMGLVDVESVRHSLANNLGPAEWHVRPVVGDPTGRKYAAKGWIRIAAGPRTPAATQ